MSRSASDHLLFEGAQIPLAGWTLIEVAGRDRERFLHSQLTSDVKGLAPGASQMTALLDRTGRLQVFGFILKRECRIELLIPDAPARAAVEALEAHVISDDVGFSVAEFSEPRLVLGAEAVRLLARDPSDQTFPVESWASRGFVAWGGLGTSIFPRWMRQISKICGSSAVFRAGESRSIPARRSTRRL